ncbi:MAG: S-layer homology domain-containing protein [Oscillospiraceae bacterium]
MVRALRGYTTVNKLAGGIGSNRCFSPDTVLTRGMFVTVLGQLAQIDEDAYPGTSFNDVEIGRWYAPLCGVGRAAAVIVSGTGNGRFEPNAPITREQMASIVARHIAEHRYDAPDDC